MILRKARHELVAQAIASGKSPFEAYVLAGFKPDSGNASRLASSDPVRQRVTEILSAMAARSVKQANYTREWVVTELIDNVALAKAAQDFGAANTALKLLGTERAMFVDRKEMGGPGAFTEASEAEVLAMVQRELGDDSAKALAAALAREDAVPDAVVSEAAPGADDTIN